MSKHIALLCSCALLLSLSSAAQNSNSKEKTASGAVAPIILSGLQAYYDGGADAAVRAWIKNGGLDGSKDALSQANNLRKIEDYYGKYRNFEVVKVRNLSPKTQIACLVLEYEKGPVFAKFIAYRTEQGWVVDYFDFNTKEQPFFSNCD
jgi:hypothetical protein